MKFMEHDRAFRSNGWHSLVLGWGAGEFLSVSPEQEAGDSNCRVRCFLSPSRKMLHKMPQIMTQYSPPTVFQINYSLIVLQYGAVYSEVLITHQINNVNKFIEQNPTEEVNK
jgi:hypothetical protein